jgi:hypothetical protein
MIKNPKAGFKGLLRNSTGVSKVISRTEYQRKRK